MKIAVLISGGVDSSLALKLLHMQGHQLEAFYLKIWLEDELSYLTSCPWEEDLSYVKKTCQMLDVPLQVIPLQEEYHKRIVTHTLAEVHAGRTPNPDILCNQFIKFGIFYDLIDSSFEKVATGHYAQIEEKEGTCFLKRAVDPLKDQTYFLCNLNQSQLKRALFPIGHLTKEIVRKQAAAFNLPSYTRKDSQGICFLGNFKFSDFIRHHLGEKEGNIREFETHKKLGSHQGHWFYTIGQRHGISLSGGPWYVVEKEASTNTVFVSHTYHNLEEQRTRFTLAQSMWIPGFDPCQTSLLVKVRHRTLPQTCTISQINEKNYCVKLADKDQGIAPGQYAVFYERDLCVGQGIIV